MKRAKRGYARKNRQWLKRHPWLKRRIPSLFPGILNKMAERNPALRHFLDFRVEKLDFFKGLAYQPPANVPQRVDDKGVIDFDPSWLEYGRGER